MGDSFDGSDTRHEFGFRGSGVAGGGALVLHPSLGLDGAGRASLSLPVLLLRESAARFVALRRQAADSRGAASRRALGDRRSDDSAHQRHGLGAPNAVDVYGHPLLNGGSAHRAPSADTLAERSLVAARRAELEEWNIEHLALVRPHAQAALTGARCMHVG
jgi:hypothetical protein